MTADVTRTQTPVLSVIIPVWNRERYLSAAITSVLEQEGCPPQEVIVVDDGSEDQSAAVAEGFGSAVHCVRIGHRGLAAARNIGVSLARGDYLLHLDSDDLLPAGSIAARMAWFDRADVDMVVGQILSFISPDLDAETASRFRVALEPQRGGLPGATLVRTGFAQQVGAFDENFSESADLDWMARAIERNPHVVDVPTVVLLRRIHGDNQSLSGAAYAASRLGILRAALDRRRASGNGSAAE